MDFQWAAPIFNFATVRATPTRRSIGDKSVEILIAPTSSSSHEAGFAGALIPIDLHASHVSVNDTTCTTQSDYFYHEFHPHSAVTCDGSPLSETELLWRNTAHRMDVLQHTCHGSVSMHGRNAAWYLYPGRTFHSRKMWIFPANAPFTFFMVLPENRAVWTARATVFWLTSSCKLIPPLQKCN